ncbi:hypothetical protein KIN20_004148 [Parelaphostrongylus tenuis]|uniref:Mos1 transposase HTH domain-containing protein n=1 Tax=Parelaphostrongylus tenuis TaxID=148309 RepID=A0AAD5QJ31_PARTN|nr:hypothetical protein KIN20_004148 [Parelaphostrongylus tenuis]
MQLSKEELRRLPHFHYELGVHASEAHREICKEYGDDICKIRTAQLIKDIL